MGATRRVVSAPLKSLSQSPYAQDQNSRACFRSFGAMELGGDVFWLAMKIKFVLWFGAGDGVLGMLMTVQPFAAACPVAQACRSCTGHWGGGGHTFRRLRQIRSQCSQQSIHSEPPGTATEFPKTPLRIKHHPTLTNTIVHAHLSTPWGPETRQQEGRVVQRSCK